jgi:hypothetical protein
MMLAGQSRFHNRQVSFLPNELEEILSKPGFYPMVLLFFDVAEVSLGRRQVTRQWPLPAPGGHPVTSHTVRF